ncbi:MAG: hypothetical protein HY332_17195 [Chloroflexi bacterium]|nr:hypothetical protein [Chloroflexota bacterium]
MRDTRLILIEGLPGSGKTTAAKALAARLAQHGIAARSHLEVQDEHPLHVGGALHPSGSTTGAALFARYTVETFVDESLRRWETFVRRAAGEPTVHVVESYPYQSTARVLLQMDAPIDRIHAYAAQLEAAMAPLAPVVVYFNRAGPAGALRAIAAQRGPQWTAYVVELVARCPYAERRGVEGLEGVAAVMGAYKALLDALLAKSRLPRLVLADCAGHWEVCYQQLDAFLGLPADGPVGSSIEGT